MYSRQIYKIYFFVGNVYDTVTGIEVEYGMNNENVW